MMLFQRSLFDQAATALPAQKRKLKKSGSAIICKLRFVIVVYYRVFCFSRIFKLEIDIEFRREKLKLFEDRRLLGYKKNIKYS